MSSLATYPANTNVLPVDNNLCSYRARQSGRNYSAHARLAIAQGNKLPLPCLEHAAASEETPTQEQNAFPAVFDPEAASRDRLVMEHLPLVRSIARRIRHRLPPHVQFEDLVHAGVLGLIEALQKFDPDKNVQFKSYARFRIQGAIVDSLRELDWAPRALRKRARELEQVHDSLRSRLGRPPSEPEVAAELGIGLKKLQRLINSLWEANMCSFQPAMSAEGTRQEGSGADRALAETEDPFSQCLRGEVNGLLARAIAALPPRGRRVLALYYFEERTMKEIARALGVCEARISQIHSAALVPLRAKLEELLAPKFPRLERVRPTTEPDPRMAFAEASPIPAW